MLNQNLTNKVQGIMAKLFELNETLNASCQIHRLADGLSMSIAGNLSGKALNLPENWEFVERHGGKILGTGITVYYAEQRL